jgi:hypothetical protein
MHRQLLELPVGVRGDHRYNNGLNNQRINLRPASCRQNSANCRKRQRVAGSKYKGVSWSKRGRGAWVVQIGKRPYAYVGRFQSEIEAAQAYDLAAKKIYGEFARPNFPAI